MASRNSSGSDTESEDWEEWTEENGDASTAVCLFCDEDFPSTEETFAHCATVHSFDFRDLQKINSWDLYESMRVVNYIRREIIASRCLHCHEEYSTRADLLKHMSSRNHFLLPADTPKPWASDNFLVPVLYNDILLCNLDTELESDVGPTSASGSTLDQSVPSTSADYGCQLAGAAAEEDGVLSANNNRYRDEDIQVMIEALKIEDEDARLDFAVSVCSRLEEREKLGTGETSHPSGDSPCSTLEDVYEISLKNGDREAPVGNGMIMHLAPEGRRRGSCLRTSGSEELRKKVSFSAVAEKEKMAINDSYFGSYSGFGIHREMISDKVRTGAYQAAIEGNPSLFLGATVMDLGTGTGILSMFAARAGAAKVVSVDGSAKMAAVARQVARDNGLLRDDKVQPIDANGVGEEGTSTKKVMTVVNGMIEDLTGKELTIEEKSVDVLVSEWMGYCLLFESMLDSVIHARDKWLRPGGAVLPDTATMYVAGVGKGGTSLLFWENVYGFNMESIGRELVAGAAEIPIVDTVAAEHILTSPCKLKHFDLVTVSVEDADFTAPFVLTLSSPATEPSLSGPGKGDVAPLPEAVSEAASERSGLVQLCYGVVVWFDVGFGESFCREKPVVMTTSPLSPATHWYQTILTFREPIAMTAAPAPAGVGAGVEPLDASPHRREAAVGTMSCPATQLQGRISIARSPRHRSIDISLEVTAVQENGLSRAWPVQLFDI